MLNPKKPFRSVTQARGSLVPAEPQETSGSVTDQISRVIFNSAPLWWWFGFLISLGLLFVFIFTFVSVSVTGTGLWGIDIPVVWGTAIVNLIFWIGIGHAGTFISAFLLLMRQQWRSTFSRFAEAMTLFALATAGIFPLLHLGRIELFYYIIPHPNTMVLHSQWRSPLVWDFVAITTYGLVSLLFWYIDLVPDLATMRDKAKGRFVKFLYGLLAMGWRGDSKHWANLHKTSYVLAALATPLVISVHSIVGLDFAIAIVPGWHHTIFPPFFVAGAIFSGLAMVLIFSVMLRSGFNLKKLITLDHMDNAAKLMLVTGLLVTYGYVAEIFGAWYSGHEEEWLLTVNRAFGNYAPAYWGMIIFNAVVVQALWFRQVRRNPALLVVISLFILVGMWLERFIIVPASLSYPYMQTMWESFTFGIWDIITVISPFGLFLTFMFLFIRLIPIMSIAEKQHDFMEEGAE